MVKMDFKSFTLLIALFSVAAAAPELTDERIVNGESIDIKEVPWQVALLMDSERHCGGSILSDRYILTAAQCLEDLRPNHLTVRAGSRYLEQGGQLLKVKRYKMHEAFGKERHMAYYDVGVVQLTFPMKLGPEVRPINLTQEAPKNGESALVCGWGRKVSWYPWYPKDLQGVYVGIMDRKTCLATSKYRPLELNKDAICTSSLDKDACSADSGGPVVVNGVQVGIVSWGTDCALPEFPRVHASVAYFYDWIHKAMKDLDKCNYG